MITNRGIKVWPDGRKKLSVQITGVAGLNLLTEKQFQERNCGFAQ
jgi:hypothetical protein